MKRHLRRIMSLVVVVFMLLSMTAMAEQSFEDRMLAIAQAAEPTVLPLSDSGEKLTILMGFYGSQVYSSMDEHPVIKKMEELTGIDLEIISPPEGDDGTFFNTIVASGDWPDLFRNEFKTYPGGVVGAIDDGILLEWNPLVEQYMPNFVTKLAGLGEKVYKHLVNDEGVYIRLGCWLDPPVLDGVQHRGMVIRKDKLDELGLEVPKTIDEFVAVLKAFKEAGMQTPFALSKLTDYNNVTYGNWLTAPWNVAVNNYMISEDGSIYYSRTSDRFKEAMIALNEWYNEGLIDRDFINRTAADAKKLVIAGDAGACIVGNWETSEMLKLGQIEDEKFEIVGVPVMRVGDPDAMINVGGKRENGTDTGAWQVSATCKDPRLAAKFIDYLYTDEAVLFTTFGIGDLGDGNSTYYQGEDGRYYFTDFMMNNPDWDFNTIRNFYTIQDLQSEFHNDFITWQYDTDIQRQCWDAWRYNLTNDELIPTTISRTVEEGRTFSANQNEIETYSDEMVYKFICGEMSIEENWSTYLATLESLGLQENIDIQTAAYQRWLNR